jgi:4-aminobutyrate aminotransferase-like enzyme
MGALGGLQVGATWYLAGGGQRDREAKEPAYEETRRFCELAPARGVIFGSTKDRDMGSIVKFKPLATITREEADPGLTVFEGVLREISRERTTA